MATLLFAGAVLAIPTLAQVWAQKTWQQWSKKECDKILSDSPWCRTWERSNISPALLVPIRTTYVAQLWSTRLVRQAIVRRAQLDSTYRSLSPDARQAQDSEGERFIAAEFPDTVVVQLVFGTNSAAGERDLRIEWQKLSLAALKDMVSLSSPRGTVAVISWTPPTGEKNELQFVFPRSVNGKPLLEEGDAFLHLSFVHPLKGILSEQRVTLEFHPKDMIAENKLEY